MDSILGNFGIFVQYGHRSSANNDLMGGELHCNYTNLFQTRDGLTIGKSNNMAGIVYSPRITYKSLSPY